MEKIVRALAIGIVIFATIIGFAVSTRIDQDTISVLSGAVIGIVTAAPFAAILTMVLMRKRDNRMVTSYERQMHSSVPMPQNPPQYWVMPQQVAAMNNSAFGQQQAALAAPGQWQSGADAYMMRPRRRFYVIGENGEPRMMDAGAADANSSTDDYDLSGSETGAAF